MDNIAVFVKNLTSGGAEKQSILLAKALSAHYKVHYIIFNGRKVHQKYMDMLNEDAKIHVKFFKGGHIYRYRALVRFLMKNNIKAIFSYLTAANFYACMAGRSVHAKVFTGLRNAELPFLKCLSDRFLTNNIAEKAISNSFSGKINFVSKGFDEHKIVVIPNCFDNIRPYISKGINKKIHIITVGRFVQQKDYETAIHAISLLRDRYNNVVFDIVGYGELEEQVRGWVKKYKIDDITTIYINPNNIPELLDKADIYLSTSLFEGTSNSIMEAMNADLPIVATNVGDNSQLVKNNVNGFLCGKKNWVDIASKLEILVKDDILRQEKGEESKKLLRANYSIDKFRQSYIDFLLKYM